MYTKEYTETTAKIIQFFCGLIISISFVLGVRPSLGVLTMITGLLLVWSITVSISTVLGIVVGLIFLPIIYYIGISAAHVVHRNIR